MQNVFYFDISWICLSISSSIFSNSFSHVINSLYFWSNTEIVCSNSSTLSTSFWAVSWVSFFTTSVPMDANKTLASSTSMTVVQSKKIFYFNHNTRRKYKFIITGQQRSFRFVNGLQVFFDLFLHRYGRTLRHGRLFVIHFFLFYYVNRNDLSCQCFVIVTITLYTVSNASFGTSKTKWIFNCINVHTGYLLEHGKYSTIYTKPNDYINMYTYLIKITEVM